MLIRPSTHEITDSPPAGIRHVSRPASGPARSGQIVRRSRPVDLARALLVRPDLSAARRRQKAGQIIPLCSQHRLPALLPPPCPLPLAACPRSWGQCQTPASAAAGPSLSAPSAWRNSGAAWWQAVSSAQPTAHRRGQPPLLQPFDGQAAKGRVWKWPGQRPPPRYGSPPIRPDIRCRAHG